MRKINKIKGMLWTVLLCLSGSCLCLSACGMQKEYVPAIVDGVNTNPGDYRFSSIMKGEAGYYYQPSSRDFNFHYYDIASGNNVYLCNRPECLHQGDEFCTATSTRYLENGSTMYDGKIYITAYDTEKEEGLDYVLLRLEPDGSNLTQLAVLKSFTSVERGILVSPEVFIHRGKCISSFAYSTEDRFLLGTIIYDLVSGEITELPTYEFESSLDGYYSASFDIRDRFMGKEDYIYYNETRPKELNGKKSKTYLCRYNILDGSTEEAELSCLYKGGYTVTEADQCVLSDKFGNLYTYNWKDKTEEQNPKTHAVRTVYREDGTMEQEIFPFSPADIFYYKGHLFGLDGIHMYGQNSSSFIPGEKKPYGENLFLGIYMFDENMEQHIDLDADFSPYYIGPEIFDSVIEDAKDEMDIEMDYPGGKMLGLMARLSLVEDVLYLQTDVAVYGWNMDEFLEGKGQFTRLYSIRGLSDGE